MKLVKSLLLGSAAGLAAVAGAQAADLPARKAAPVEYVRVCSAYGVGFFYVPGTEGCLRLSGRVRADYLYSEPFTRANDSTNFRVRGRLNVDHRLATAYGLLRTYIRYEITRNSGTGFGQERTFGSDPQIQQGFIQFGGLTAGRVTSFFDNPDLPTAHMGTLRFSDSPDVNLLAYTFSGWYPGFSATISIEDSHDRQTGLTPFGVAFGGFAPGFAPLPFAVAGERMPDVVGNVKYAGTWGGAQLSGAVHQVRDIGFTTLVPPVNPVTGTFLPAFADTEYGFAVMGSAYVNLPWLGAADAAWIAATYTHGAVGYISGGASQQGQLALRGFTGLPFGDAFVNPFTGDLETTKAWSIAGGVTHNWTPQFRSSLFGSYAQFEADGFATGFVPVNATTLALGTAGTVVGVPDLTEWRIGANTFWTPVSGLNIGVEVLYARLDSSGRVAVPFATAAGTATGFFRPAEDADLWEGRLRIQRDF